MEHNSLQNIAILGSTGSIGTQTLDIISEHPDRFRADVLTARSNWELLAEQARIFKPSKVVIADDRYYPLLKEALNDKPIAVESGSEAIASAAGESAADTVVTAMVGYSGLIPTIMAIRAGKRIALANKETLVVAGEVITRLLKQSSSEIIPVDSEHSAIFQALMGEKRDQASKIILTASGGPFRTLSADRLHQVSPADALRHPNWDMGAKVTIDSASMMNKGFEMIEAKWLFDFNPDDIEIVVHPQSIVHSMVEFQDGSIKAQLGQPDMRIPISLALGYPDRLSTRRAPLSLRQYATLTFEHPDYEKFPLLGMAFDAIKEGGNMPCILNAANEIAVEAFLKERIRFTDMPRLVAEVMESTPFIADVVLEDLIHTNKAAREIANEILKKYIYNN
ncbi:MAG: 1-deoxy-D-xylulose-5-phosphate reductoisomerase [Muribaculaceae bacterium]|nr:1-deoxy-D-xylulose-5-phosphate reductoisomerase [Muribaculaceae bacterium]